MISMDKELWKDIPNYEGLYQVSNLGNVKSLKKELKKRQHRNGYLCVVLYKNKKAKEILIHRLVAMTFLNNKNNYECINHINGIKTDNRADNLEWCTYSHNTKEAYRNGLLKANYEVLRNNSKKLSTRVLQLDKNTKEVIKEWDSMKQAETTLNIKTHINEVISGKRKSAGGYLWEVA